MASSHCKLEDRGFSNWLKGALAVHFTKEGLEDFVGDEMIRHQKDVLALVCSNNGLLAGTVCSSCTTANVIPCPTPTFCSKGKRCTMHDPRKPDKNPNQRCPNTLCDGIRNCINIEHKFTSPSWKNTDASGWCTDPFEIAKCYMPLEGYSAVKSFSDTDFNGILAVIINNKRFQNKMLANYKVKCEKARDVGRIIRHSADLSLQDAEFTQHVTDLIDLLSDTKCLATYQKAQEAVTKLNQMKANTLTITTDDLTTVLNDSIRATVEQERQNITSEADGHKTEIKDESKATVDLLDEVKQMLHECKTLTVANLDDLLSEKIKSVLKEADLNGRKESRDVQTLTEIDQEGSSLERDRQKEVPKTTRLQLMYACFRSKRPHESLKEDLVTFYKQRHSTIPVSPLIEEHDFPLVDFYVQPRMVSIDIQNSCHQGPLARKHVHSYKDFIFHKDTPHQNIYITAKAGVGKTSFTKRICITWCQAHCPNKRIKTRFNDEEIGSMKRFDYLFMIPMRETKKGECNVEDMIYSLVKRRLSRSENYTRKLVEDILHNSRCLIVLDGLDEWAHPEKCDRKAEEIPHRKCREKCTFITTTRPWKLNFIPLGTNQIDMHAEICQLDKTTYNDLVSTAVSLLNSKNVHGELKSADDFHHQIAALKLCTLQYIPYILLQLICLWYDGKPFGNTRCEIFSNIIELTLARGRFKCATPNINKDLQPNPPKCFISKTWCTSHYGMLQNLGQLAFDTLFSPHKESALVFGEDVITKYLSQETLTYCLKIGLLSQNKEYGSLSSRQSNFSFLHKSIQEFFSALYIQSHIDHKHVQEILSNICNSVSTIVDMSNVFIFVSGFNAEAAGKISYLLVQSVSSDKMMSQYRKSLSGYFINSDFLRRLSLRHSLQAMYVDIAKEFPRDMQHKPQLFVEDITVDNENKHESHIDCLKDLTEINKNNVKTLCVREIESTKEFEYILQTLRLMDIKSLQKLVIWAVPNQSDLRHLLEGSKHTLECFSLDLRVFKNGNFFPHYPKIAPECIRTIINMENLDSFSLEYVQLKHADLETLCEFLSIRNRMTQICLLFVKCTDHGDECNGHSIDLSRHERLNGIALDTVNISQFNINTHSLEECGIGYLPPSVRDTWLRSLPDGGNFQTLTCIRLSKADLPAVSNTLRRLEHLRYLSLNDANLEDSALCLTQTMAKLEVVWLLRVSMKKRALRSFVESVNALLQPVQVILEACLDKSGREHRVLMNQIRKSPKYCVLVDKVNGRQQREFSFKTNRIEKKK